MSNIIQLTTKPYNTPIAFEITNIKVCALSRDVNSSANVNDVDVWESYSEVIYQLKELCSK